MHMSIRFFLYVFSISLSIVLLPAGHVFAQRPEYAAETGSIELRIQPGESKRVTLKFKNVGSKTWIGGKGGTAVYLYGDLSILRHTAWIRDDLPAYISQKIVKPGSTASATFFVKAPATPGTYTERFLLSHAPQAWTKGSVIKAIFLVQGAQRKRRDMDRKTREVSIRPSDIKDVVKRINPLPPRVSRTETATTSSMTASVKHELVASPPHPSPSLHTLRAELIDRGGIEWQLDPGQHTLVTLAFKNIGTTPWSNTGTGYIALSPVSKKNKSRFQDISWASALRAAQFTESMIQPGQIGHIRLQLRAPEIPGNYRETFQLVASGTRAILGSELTLPIRVTIPREYIAKGIMNGVELTQAEPHVQEDDNYKAALLLSSPEAQRITLLGNGRTSLTYGFKNVGTRQWNSLSVKFLGILPTMMQARLASLRDESWLTGIEVAHTTNVTAPGHIGFIGMTLKAPVKRGVYAAKFQLYADGEFVEDGQIEIPITVTADGSIEPEASASASSPPTMSGFGKTDMPLPLMGDLAVLPAEPIIRVGLFATTDDRMRVRAVSGGFILQNNGSIVCRFEARETVIVSYDRATGVSRATGPGCADQTSGVYVAVAPDGISPLELSDYSRPVSWLPGANDNTFRGKLELRYAKATDSVWIINELPVEWYLKGIAETSNSSPQEYQRALLTAARTYAMYHVRRGTKHADENYTVDAKYDQVYRGYGAEARDSNVVIAVDATRGQVVTYNGALAITPYYSRSDGRTRAWTEVWGGSAKAWLVSVPVPWDAGKTLWGHGVGMSATGALGMGREGKTYDQILKHFYTGTELRMAYK